MGGGEITRLVSTHFGRFEIDCEVPEQDIYDTNTHRQSSAKTDLLAGVIIDGLVCMKCRPASVQPQTH